MSFLIVTASKFYGILYSPFLCDVASSVIDQRSFAWMMRLLHWQEKENSFVCNLCVVQVVHLS